MVGFTGGDKLRSKLLWIAAKLESSKSVDVGFLEGGTEPDGQSTPMVAAIQEFGSSSIPPRPFMRPTVAEHSGDWGDELGAAVKACDYSAERALAMMGEVIKGQIQASIKAVVSPPLAASTVKRKGFDTPLIDTGTMWQGVDYTVKS